MRKAAFIAIVIVAATAYQTPGLAQSSSTSTVKCQMTCTMPTPAAGNSTRYCSRTCNNEAVRATCSAGCDEDGFPIVQCNSELDDRVARAICGVPRR